MASSNFSSMLYTLIFGTSYPHNVPWRTCIGRQVLKIGDVVHHCVPDVVVNVYLITIAKGHLILPYCYNIIIRKCQIKRCFKPKLGTIENSAWIGTGPGVCNNIMKCTNTNNLGTLHRERFCIVFSRILLCFCELVTLSSREVPMCWPNFVSPNPWFTYLQWNKERFQESPSFNTFFSVVRM